MSTPLSHSLVRCAIIDDEVAAREMLTRRIAEHLEVELVGVFTSVEEAAPELNGLKIELLFLDIELEGINGIDFLKLMRPNIQVIIVSAYREYAVEGFALKVLDYLEKPVTKERFAQAIQKFKESRWFAPELIQFPVNQKRLFVKTESIIRLQADGDYFHVHIRDRDPLLITGSLKSMVVVLPSSIFWQVHRSHIINIVCITSVEGNIFTMVGGFQVPIGKTYQPEISQRLRRK